jgi:hypothetical protein
MDGTTCSVGAVELRVGARFCDACGHPVAAAAPASPDPSTFTPEHIAEKMRASRFWRRRTCSVWHGTRH